MPDQEAAETEDYFQENKKKQKREYQKSRNDQAAPIAVMLLSDVAKQNSFSRRCDADDDSQEDVGNKEENQKPMIGMKDFQNPLEKTSSRSSRTSAPLPIKDSVTTLKNQNPARQEPEEYTRRLLSDVETQIGFFKGAIFYNEENKKYPFLGNNEENQKPVNGVEDFQNPVKKTSSRSSRTSAPLPIKDSVTTLRNQNPPRQEPEESYTRRLLSDVETQIGFFKGAIFYNEENKKYPFLDSKSMKEFIANWLQVDVSDTNLIEVVKQLKLQYKRKLVEIEGKLNCLCPDKERAFDWAHKIWGNPEKLVLRSSVYEEGECSTKCQNGDDYGGDDQGSVKKMKKNHEITVPYNIKISILNGIINYKKVVGRSPFHAYGDLISFNTSWIPLKVPVETLISWTENLMIEYKEVRKRATDSFKSAEEREFFELGHQLWGSR